MGGGGGGFVALYVKSFGIETSQTRTLSFLFFLPFFLSFFKIGFLKSCVKSTFSG